MFCDLPAVVEAALEVRVALLDQRRTDLARGHRREPEFFEFVDFASRAIAYADDLIHEIGRGQIDHAFLAPPQHLEAMVCVPDVAREERRRETQHHVPTHGHDVGLSTPRRTHEYDWAGFEIPADLIEWKITFPIGAAFHRWCESERDATNHSAWRVFAQPN